MTRGASLPAAASRAGNQLPNGARRRRSTDSSTASQPAKSPSIALDLKLAFEHALNKTAKLKQEEKDPIVTMAVTGIEQLVVQFAKGDCHARRDLLALADKFGVDLLAGQHRAIRETLTSGYVPSHIEDWSTSSRAGSQP